MLHRARSGDRPWRAAVVAGMLGAIALAGPVSAQPTAPKTIVVLSASKDSDKKAIEDADGYFADLKKDAGTDEKLKKLQAAEKERADKGKAPGFPGADDAVGSAADLAAAAVLAPAGLGEALAAGAAPVKAGGPRYGWYKIGGARELRILDLNKGGKEYKEALKAKDKVHLHSRFGFPLCHRAGAGDAVEFFVLCAEPAEDLCLTGADLVAVEPAPGGAMIELAFTQDEVNTGRAGAGQKRLKALTEKGNAGRFLVVVGAPGVLEIMRVGAPIENGKLRAGSGLDSEAFTALLKQMQALRSK